MTFSELGLQAAILDSITEMGYKEPTPIQLKAIPALLSGQDIVGSAQTGTGKTAAFALPILQKLGTHAPGPRCLVLTPTRELAFQNHENFVKFAKHTKLRCGLSYGGVGYGKQREELARGIDVLVGTPGRLLDHLGSGVLKLNRISFLVLDEADRMLDMGFLPDVRRIIQKCPVKRQTAMFSATIPPALEGLCSWALVKPLRIQIDRDPTTAAMVKHVLYPVADGQKKQLLIALLEELHWQSIIIFCRTRRSADEVASFLRQHKHRATAIHSDRSQSQREQALKGFRDGKFEVLVATDIASRGLDISDVTHVINFNVPEAAEDYVHRVGRTGRAETKGDALTIFAAGDAPYVAAIERYIKSKIERVKLENFPYQYTALFDESRTGPTSGRKSRGARIGRGYFFGPAKGR
jgi:superfamily II DNA/RNA helicase